jgi:hypothetical protein
MAGFKRTNIEGFTLKADPELVKLLRRHGPTGLGRVLREAQNNGQTRVLLNEVPYILHYHPDHTITIDSTDERHHIV